MATITQLIMKKRNANEDDEQLISEIHRLSEALTLAYERFELHSENDLVVSDQPGLWCLGDWCTPEDIEIPQPFVNNYF